MLISRRHLLGGLATAPLLACGTTPCDAGVDVANWLRNAGRVMVMGDSITIGYWELVGGWRPGLSAALTAAGVGHTYVGPYSDAYGAHRGVSGTAAFLQTSAVQGDCDTYDPRVVIIGYGINDLGGGGADVPTTLAAIEDVIGWTRAGAPQAIILVQSIIVPGPANASYYAHASEIVEANAQLPARVAAAGAIFVDVGAPEQADGVHLTAAGNASMAAVLAAAVLAALPGR